MKKLSLLLLITLSLSLLNCKKDNSDDSKGDPVPVTITENSNSNRALSFVNLDLIVKQITGEQSKNTATTSITANYEYDGKHFVKITTNTGSDVTVKEYYYADMDHGILDSIVYKKNGQFTAVDRFEVSNGHIQQITKFDANNTVKEKATFSNYNGDKPQQISLYTMTILGAMNVSGSLIYNGDDVTGLSTTGTLGSANISLNITNSFDTKNNIFLNVETKEWPVSDKHNIISTTTELNFSGSPNIETKTYTYTYNNDDYPITSTFTSTDSSSGSSEFVYEDK